MILPEALRGTCGGGEAPGLGIMEKVLKSECVPQIHVLMVFVGTVWEGD